MNLKTTLVAAAIGTVSLAAAPQVMAYQSGRVEYRGITTFGEHDSGGRWLFGELSLFPTYPAKFKVKYAETGDYNLAMSTRCSGGKLQKTKRYATSGTQSVTHACGTFDHPVRTQAALDDI